METSLDNKKEMLAPLTVISGPNAESDQAGKERASIMERVTRINKFIGTLRENIHQTVLIPSVLYAWKYRDANFIGLVLTGLTTASKDTLRVESLAYWMEEYAGFAVKYDREKDQFTTKAKFMQKSKCPLQHSFSYDVDHLNILKDPSNRYWKVAPVQIQLLKAPVMDDAFTKLAKESAKALLIGEIDIETLQAQANAMLANIEKFKHDKKVVEWVNDYNSPDQVKLRAERQAKVA